MCEKMQDSGLTEIITFLGTSAVWGKYPGAVTDLEGTHHTGGWRDLPWDLGSLKKYKV